MTRLAYTFLLTILFLAPLACLPGAAGLWTTALLEALSIGLLLLCLFNAGAGRLSRQQIPGIVPLAALAGFLLLQMVPLPPFLLRLVSAQTWDFYADTVWVVRPGVWMPLSLSVEATLTQFFRVFSFAAVYLATVHLLASRERLKKTIPPLSAYVGLFSLVAIGMFLLPGNTLVLLSWERPDLVQDHFAGLLAMAFPLVLAQYLSSRPHVSHLPLREKMVNFMRQLSFRPHVLLGASCMVVVVAILLSQSWGGFLSSLGALLVFFLFLLTRRRGRQKEVWGTLLLLGLLFLLGLAVSGSIGSGPAGTDAVLSAEAKQLVRRDSLEIFRDFSLFGTGAGTFSQIYPRYKTIPGEDLSVEHATNDILESLVETGLVGTLLFAWFMLLVLYRGYAAWRRRHSRTSVYLYLGCVSGLTAIVLHGWSSSTLHVVAAGFYVAFFCGLAVAAAMTSSRRTNPEPVPIPPSLLRWSAYVTVTILLLNLGSDVGSLVGRALYGGSLASPGQSKEKARSVPTGAALLDPLAAGYRYALADADLASGDPSRAMSRFGTALRLAPLNAEYLQRLGLVLDHLGQAEQAEKLLRAGAETDRSNPERHKTFAFWLLKKGKKEEALEHVRQAVFWGPQKTWDYLSLMALNGLSEEEMRRTLPERSIPMLAFGDYLASIGLDSAAEQSYRSAVLHAMNEQRPRPEPFYRAADFFAERGHNADALEIILMGVEIFPKNPDLRLSAANLYERLGIVYRAVQEYRGVLAFDPDNEEARDRLNALDGAQR